MIKRLSTPLIIAVYFSLTLLAVAQDSPEALADKAVSEWLEQTPPTLTSLAGLASEEVCNQLPSLIYAAPQGLDVNLNARKQLEPPKEAPDDLLIFTYPASQPGEIVGTVRVSLTQSDDGYSLRSVQYTPELTQGGFRTWLTGITGSLLFSVFSLFCLYLVFSKSFLRKWLMEGFGYLKEHKKITFITIGLLYGLFALGYAVGTTLPAACGDFLLTLIQQSIDQLGVNDAAASRNVAGLSAAIFYQNFTFGTVLTTYLPALVFGIPAYLFNGSRFFALALLFGYSGLGGFLNTILALILFLVELMAYVLVTAGGGMLMMTLIRGGFKVFRIAYRKLIMMIPIAALLLIIGAWYEASIIILPLLFSSPSP